MIYNVVLRDIQSRYMGSFLGVFWSILHPLVQLSIYYFIFSVVLKARLGAEYAGTHFAIWLISGMLPWLLFAEILSRSPGAVLEQTVLIKKAVFPSEIFPLSHVIAALVNHCIALTLLLAFLLLTGNSFSINIFWLPFYLFGICFFALGISWFVSALNVYLRDIGHLMGFIVHVWFFMTPILYPIQLIPESFRSFIALNPMIYPVEGYRMSLLGRSDPSMEGVIIIFTFGLAAFVLGGLVFRKLKPTFADVL